jgi:hypothetical protein
VRPAAKRLAEHALKVGWYVGELAVVPAPQGALCVKEPEAEPMGGLEGEALEQALKSDARAKELGDPGTKHAPPPMYAVSISPDGTPRVTKVPEKPKPPSGDLPEGVKMAMWIPITQGDGSTIFQCSVEGFSLRATAVSRNTQKALAYCLEDLARQILETEKTRE